MSMSQGVLRNGLLFLVGCCNLSYGANLMVCANASYTSIGAAVAAAASGDEIDICPAVYAEQLVLTKPVTLHGLAANGIERVLVQPATMTNVGTPPFQL
jgi:hypothetical protein